MEPPGLGSGVPPELWRKTLRDAPWLHERSSLSIGRDSSEAIHRLREIFSYGFFITGCTTCQGFRALTVGQLSFIFSDDEREE